MTPRIAPPTFVLLHEEKILAAGGRLEVLEEFLVGKSRWGSVSAQKVIIGDGLWLCLGPL